MLRRPLTTLTITPEDIADYEDRLAEKARVQARFIARRDREERRRSLNPPLPPSHPSHPSHSQSRRRTIASSSPSPPPPQQQQQHPSSSSPVEEEEEEVSYYARAQHQARQVSLSFQAQQTPMQGDDGQQGGEDEDVEMMTAPPLPQTRSQARMGMGVGMGGEMETPSVGRGPVRRSTRERSREVEQQQQVVGGTIAGRLRAAGRGRQNGMEMVTPETRPGGRSREERIGVGQGGGGGGGGGMMPPPPAAPRRGRRGE